MYLCTHTHKYIYISIYIPVGSNLGYSIVSTPNSNASDHRNQHETQSSVIKLKQHLFWFLMLDSEILFCLIARGILTI